MHHRGRATEPEARGFGLGGKSEPARFDRLTTPLGRAVRARASAAVALEHAPQALMAVCASPCAGPLAHWIDFRRNFGLKVQERGAGQPTVSPPPLRGWAEREETRWTPGEEPEIRLLRSPASRDGARPIGSVNVVVNSLRGPA